MEKIQLLYFAGIKDITQKESEEIELLSANWTLSNLSDLLVDKYGPKMKELLSNSMFAVNMDYVEKSKEASTVLEARSEVALIPPVSGG